MTRAFALPLDLRSADERLLERFWSKVSVDGPDECWEWTGHRKVSGYGAFRLREGVYVTASRASLAMRMPLDAGEVACHHCDNPPCVNPAHLFRGTQSDNAFDMLAKGRCTRSHGEAHFSAKLTEAAVIAIRSADLSKHGAKSQIAREFGVSLTAIRRVLAGKTWRSVK